ncbi:pimeloyl-ACP methyl ester carboxylesterase [Okibacterium sp. HSC-33S16]|uniref:alpha/beta fold hydrolase n=1 Tax=Okibacterium sp. HSC-33S16 TaxID=2910965 RepID=UPI00209F4FFA|nr:alpha/beta fold hydrolase [Okibacterium sp. HSC-33S16]MCP2031392.1 pimeloyl-ACP methyl ester carboxylesterase [Okibacterium sp. HSC-33S16]
MPHLDVPGARLYYETDGHAADEPLLLIHAGIATLRMWDPIVAALATNHYVIRYDTRGFGETTSGPEAFSDRDDARAILDHLGVLRPTIIGASRGGRIGLDIAVETPDRVAGIATIGSGPSGFPEVELTDAEDDLCTKLDEAFEAKDHQRIADLEVRLWSIGPLRNEQDLDGDFVRTAFELNRLNLRHHDSAIGESIDLEPPAYDQIVDLEIPALVTVGEFDITPALIQFEYLAQSIPNATRHVFPDTAHLPSVERPREFLEVLSPWLSDHGL